MIGTMFSVLFNKNLLDDYSIEYPYTYADDGTWTIDNLYYSSGMNIVVKDKEMGMKVSPDFGSEKMTELVTKLCGYFHDGNSTFLAAEIDAFPVFVNENALFSLASLNYAINNLRR